LLIIWIWATCGPAFRPCRLVCTKRPSTTESLNCAHSRVATVIMPSCPCQFLFAQAVHVLLSSSIPGVSRPRPYLVINFFINLRRCFLSCDNHADVSLFARQCHVFNRNGRYTFRSVFRFAAGPEPLTAFACALIMCQCRSSTNTSVACMHCSRRFVKSTEACQSCTKLWLPRLKFSRACCPLSVVLFCLPPSSSRRSPKTTGCLPNKSLKSSFLAPA